VSRPEQGAICSTSTLGRWKWTQRGALASTVITDGTAQPAADALDDEGNSTA
jgi:hypothetical protein